MALQKVNRNLLNTGVSDSSDATAITIDSSENCGIGTSSPQRQLHVLKVANNTHIAIERDGTDNPSALILGANQNRTEIISSAAEESTSGVPLTFLTGNTERMRIDSSGLVGIGQTPSSSDGSMLQITGNDGIQLKRSGQTNGFVIRPNASTDGIRFTQGGTGDRMTIDASGNLLIGKTSTDAGSTAGVELRGGIGFAAISRSGDVVANFSRLTNDGNIVAFRKDSTDVGYIGTESTDIYIGTTDTGIRFNDAVNGVLPYNTSTGQTDATLDLGFSSVRWKDLYLSGGAFIGGTGSANKLDDYEEGSWTPVVKINSSTTGITGNFGGTYTKVGREVTVVCYINFTNKGSTTGNLLIDSLPFNSGNLGMRFHGSVGYYHLSLSSGDHPRARLTPQSSGFDIQRNHEISPVSNTNLANNTEFYVTLTYFTD
jgi:hypothetical protein